jgi:hypothetical protein
MVVLVCGGRAFRDAFFVVRTLDDFRKSTPIELVIQGGARGVDSVAHAWAVARGIPCDTYPADWAAHGRRAGPIRNARMLAEGRPDLVVAFPGGPGTADMVRQAERAGVRVVRVGGGR